MEPETWMKMLLQTKGVLEILLQLHLNSASHQGHGAMHVSTLPSSNQGSIRVEAEVMDSFTVTFLMKNFLLNLQVPQTPRVVITAHRYK